MRARRRRQRHAFNNASQVLLNVGLSLSAPGRKNIPVVYNVVVTTLTRTCLEPQLFILYPHQWLHGRLYSVDWTRDWTRDWTVGLDSQKVALVILKHQTLLKYLHDMNGIRGSRPYHDSISAVPSALSVRARAPTMHCIGSFPDWNGLGTRTMNNYRPTAQAGGKQKRKRQPNLAGACIETVQEAAKWL